MHCMCTVRTVCTSVAGTVMHEAMSSKNTHKFTKTQLIIVVIFSGVILIYPVPMILVQTKRTLKLETGSQYLHYMQTRSQRKESQDGQKNSEYFKLIVHRSLSALWETASKSCFLGGILALCTHCALLLDYVPPEEALGTPLGNTLRIRRPKLDWRGP